MANVNMEYSESEVSAADGNYTTFIDGIDESVQPIENENQLSVCRHPETINGAQVIYLAPKEMVEQQDDEVAVHKFPTNWARLNELSQPKSKKIRGPKKKSKFMADGCTSTENVAKSWFTSKKDKNDLANSGVKWRNGQWLKEEIQLLEENIQEYCEKNSIMDVRSVIFEMTKEKRKDFYRCVASGLERPLFSVYRRVTRMYDQKNYVGKYTPKEVDRLAMLREIHKNDWITIGNLMGRSASSVKDRSRLMKKCLNSGKWLNEEEQRLTNAVQSLTKAEPGKSITQGLSWSEVAKKVETRSEKQCRTKWLNYLNWKQIGGKDWKREDDYILLDKILEFPEEKDIDWNKICENWSSRNIRCDIHYVIEYFMSTIIFATLIKLSLHSVRSPQWLRSKWWNFKRLLPQMHGLSFTEFVLQLKDMKLRAGEFPATFSTDEFYNNPYEGSKLISDMSNDLNLFQSANQSDSPIIIDTEGHHVTATINENDPAIISIIQPGSSNNEYYSLVQAYSEDSSNENSQDEHLIFVSLKNMQADDNGQISLVNNEYDSSEQYNGEQIILQQMPILNQNGQEILLQTPQVLDGQGNIYDIQTDDINDGQELCIINVNSDMTDGEDNQQAHYVLMAESAADNDPLILPTLIGESQLIGDNDIPLVTE